MQRFSITCFQFVFVFCAVTAVLGRPGQAETSAVVALAKLGATMEGVSVSGISSGAYMAGQFQMAHSRHVTGAAIIAGGPYGCARSAFSAFTFGFGREMANLAKAVSGCMLNLYQIWGVPNAARLARQAELLSERKKIGPLAAVTSDKVYLFSGQSDRTVVPAIVRAAEAFYRELGVPTSHIKRVMTYRAGHAFVTEDEGSSCELSAAPFVVDCDYDQAGDLLAHIYGPLSPRSAQAAGRYQKFDQRPFLDPEHQHGLAEHGWVYIPQVCMTEPSCRVHIAFHGCGQNHNAVGDAFVKGSGFDRWADTNRLIVLYPQTVANSNNHQACWDWWGYTGEDFLTRDGKQIQAVYRMLKRLAGSPDARPH